MTREVYAIVVQGQGVRQVRRDFDDLGRSVNIVRSSLAFLRSMLVVIASTRILGGIVEYIDIFTKMENRIKLVTNTQQEMLAVQSQLFAVSQRTRTGLEANTDLYFRLSQSTLNLGLNYKELIDITETLAKTLIISGATATEASKGLVQLGQALAAGAIRGDELVSITEQIPALANIIAKEFTPELTAKGFAVVGASLRSLNEEFRNMKPGILTTSRIIKAINDNAEEMDAKFEKLTPTIGQGFTKLNNAVLTFVGNLNKASGIGGIIYNMLDLLAVNIDKVAVALLALASLFVFNALTAQLTSFVMTFVRGGTMIFTVLNFLTGGVYNLVRAFGFIPGAIVDYIKALGSALRALIAPLINAGVAAARFFVMFSWQAMQMAAQGVAAMVRGYIALGAALTRASVFAGTMAVRMAAIVSASAARSIALGASAFVAYGTAILAATTATIAFLARSLLLNTALIAMRVVSLAASVNIMALARALMTGVGALLRFTAAFLLSPFGIGLALIGALVAAVIYFGDEIAALIPGLDELTYWFDVMVAGFIAGISVIWNNFDLLWKAVIEGLVGMVATALGWIEDMIDGISSGINLLIDGLNLINPFEEIGQIGSVKGMLGSDLKSGYEGAGEELGKAFSEAFAKYMKDDNRASNIIKRSANDALEFFKGLTGENAIPEGLQELLLGKPLGSGSGGSTGLEEDAKGAKKLAQELKRVTDSVQQLQSSVSPFLAMQEKLVETTKLLDDAERLHVKTMMDREEIMRRVIRSEIGVGNMVTDTREKFALYTAALDSANISQAEFNKLTKEQLGISTELDDLQIHMENLDVLFADGTVSAELYGRAVREALGVERPLEVVTQQIDFLNEAFQKGIVTTEEYIRRLRELKIAALEVNTDTVSGWQRGILKVQEEYTNSSKLAEQTITNAFSNAEDALVEFFQTGKASFSDFIDQLHADLLRLAVRNVITGPLSQMLGLNQDGTMGGGGGTDFFSGIFNRIFGAGNDGSYGAKSGGGTGFLGSIINAASGIGGGMSGGQQGGICGCSDGLGGTITDAFTRGSNTAADGISGAFSEGGSGFLGGLGDILGDLLGGLGDMLTGLFDSIGSLFSGGGSGGGGLFSSIFDGIGSLFGFANGGQFKVGGVGGIDSQLVAFRATPDETVTVTKPGQESGGGRPVQVVFNISTPDADSFRRSENQIYGRAAGALQRANARNN